MDLKQAIRDKLNCPARSQQYKEAAAFLKKFDKEKVRKVYDEISATRKFY